MSILFRGKESILPEEILIINEEKKFKTYIDYTKNQKDYSVPGHFPPTPLSFSLFDNPPLNGSQRKITIREHTI